MHSTQRHWLNDRLQRIGPPLAWAIATTATLTVFAIIVMIVNYAPLNRESEKRIATELPVATYETVSALIKAMGTTCVRVCAIAPGPSLLSETTLDVACAAETAANACLSPTHYRVSVEEVPASPQR